MFKFLIFMSLIQVSFGIDGQPNLEKIAHSIHYKVSLFEHRYRDYIGELTNNSLDFKNIDHDYVYLEVKSAESSLEGLNSSLIVQSLVDRFFNENNINSRVTEKRAITKLILNQEIALNVTDYQNLSERHPRTLSKLIFSHGGKVGKCHLSLNKRKLSEGNYSFFYELSMPGVKRMIFNNNKSIELNSLKLSSRQKAINLLRSKYLIGSFEEMKIYLNKKIESCK